MSISPPCIYVLHIGAWCQKRPKKVSNTLGLELQTAAGHMWGLGMESLSSTRAAIVLNREANSPVPWIDIYTFTFIAA